MASLKDDPITAKEISAFLKTESDFSFEMSVAKILTNLKYKVTHGGYYQDPITDKIREFDIRANFAYNNGGTVLHLAVECKNLRKNFPLLIHCKRRDQDQAYHNILRLPKEEELRGPDGFLSGSYNHDWIIKITDTYKNQSGFTPYRKDDWVGKSMDQIGLDTNNKFKSGDQATFEKMSQAISSVHEMIDNAFNEVSPPLMRIYHAFVPVLVVPDETLWVVNYNSDGDIVSEPKQTNHVQYYIGKKWSFNVPYPDFTISHLDIITIGYLKAFHSANCINQDQIEGYFNRHKIGEAEEQFKNQLE